MHNVMDRQLAHLIAVLCAVVSALVFFLLGYAIAGHLVGLYTTAVWIGLYIAWNVGVVNQQEWQCVERIGQFYEIKLGGIRFYCMRGLIDTVRASGNLLERQKDLFANLSQSGRQEEIDFRDGSAPIHAYMWIKNGFAGGTQKQLEEALVAYSYASEDPEARAVQIAEDWLRPRFQAKTIDEASNTRADVVNGVRASILTALTQYGLYFAKEPPIIIADIGLTDQVKQMRQERMRGKTTAEEIASEAEGYRMAIEAIMYRTEPDGTKVIVCDFETAATIWKEQQTRKMFEKTGSNVTVLGNSANNVIKAFEIDISNKR